MRGRKIMVILMLGFLIGISLLLYPAFSDYWNSKTQTRAIVNYESVLEHLEPEDYSAIFQQAYDYNKQLYESEINPILYPEQFPGYWDTLDVTDFGMIGYLKIDRIGVELPVYHGTSAEVLSYGVGHLEGSSLPVGGESTHSVMSAHRGLPSARLFTDLDRVELGDTFQIIVLDQILTYQVDQIKIVYPNEIEDLQIVEGKDCTPEQAQIKELFSGVMVFDSKELFRVLPQVGCANVQKEYYVTEVPELMVKQGMKVETFAIRDGNDLRGVNTPEDLEMCEKMFTFYQIKY